MDPFTQSFHRASHTWEPLSSSHTNLSAHREDVTAIDAVDLTTQGTPNIALNARLKIWVIDKENTRKFCAQGIRINHDTATPNLVHLARGCSVREALKRQGIPKNTIAHQLLHESQVQEATSGDMPRAHRLFTVKNGQNAGVSHNHHAASDKDLLLNLEDLTGGKVNNAACFVLRVEND